MKLLDITEQPVNAMARKRKRQQELEEAAAEKKKAQEQRAAEKQVSVYEVTLHQLHNVDYKGDT